MSTDSPDNDPLIGTLIDQRYRVLSRLGDGGMGIVYKVEHTRLNKLFALKVMRPTKDEIDRKRFEQEARLASRIKHQNVVEISDYGVLDATDQPYFVMEFLRGQTLGDAIYQGRVSPLLACRIAEQIASGLQAVHKQNVVHRDLKPENIFLIDPDDQPQRAAEGHDGGEGAGGSPAELTFVKIMDFGIAKSIDNKLTGTNMTLGTPEYMSPEQAVGDKIDWRSDQYSLGCMLYEMLTGTIPFDGKGPFEIMNKHLTEQPVPPCQLRPELKGAIPAALEGLVLRMMQKQKMARFATMRAVEEALHERAAMLRELVKSENASAARTLLMPPRPDPDSVPTDPRPRRPPPDLVAPPSAPTLAEDDGRTRPSLAALPLALREAQQAEYDRRQAKTRQIQLHSQDAESSLIDRIQLRLVSAPSLESAPAWQRSPILRAAARSLRAVLGALRALLSRLGGK